MIRIIVRTDDAGMAVNVGGAVVLSTFRTIDIEAPEVEAALLAGGRSEDRFCHTQVVGVEVLPASEARSDG